jgi:hypothetical protein
MTESQDRRNNNGRRRRERKNGTIIERQKGNKKFSEELIAYFH